MAIDRLDLCNKAQELEVLWSEKPRPFSLSVKNGDPENPVLVLRRFGGFSLKQIDSEANLKVNIWIPNDPSANEQMKAYVGDLNSVDSLLTAAINYLSDSH